VNQKVPSELAQRTEVDLLHAVARGERKALGELYDRLAPQMLVIAQRMLGGQHEAEDLIHDVFLEIWRHAGHYDHERAKVTTWFLLRVRSRARDRLRRARRVDTLELGASLQATEASDHPANDIDDVRDGKALQLVIGDLPAEQRRVLELSYFAGYSHQEIALTLAIPIGTVKSRAARAIARLRQCLQANDSRPATLPGPGRVFHDGDGLPRRAKRS
jgi:RNA polymerase sigma-70 factor, ECF subfamily